MGRAVLPDIVSWRSARSGAAGGGNRLSESPASAGRGPDVVWMGRRAGRFLRYLVDRKSDSNACQQLGNAATGWLKKSGRARYINRTFNVNAWAKDETTNLFCVYRPIHQSISLTQTAPNGQGNIKQR